MPFFTPTSLEAIKTAISGVSAVQGAYQAVSIMAKGLSDVETPNEFDRDVKKLENQVGSSYQGPENAAAEVLKAAKSATQAESNIQQALVELIALVMTRLGIAQATKVLGVLLLACGADPTMGIITLQICLALSRTEQGKKLLSQVKPQLVDTLKLSGKSSQALATAEEICINLGDQGKEIAQKAQLAVRDTAEKTVKLGTNAMNRMLDMLEEPDNKNDDLAGS